MKESVDEFLDAVDKSVKNCPWTIKQPLQTYVDGVIEEANEIKQAIEKKDYENLKEEIGDLLWDAIILAHLAQRDGHFDTKEVLQSAIKKMKHRKPYIFTGEKVTVEEAQQIWKDAKAEEKNGST